MTVLEFVLLPKEGPALHTHLREDELWYVLDGDFRFKAGDALFRASKGGMAFGPRGTPHCFQNVGDAAARLLVITTPSGLERFFEEYAELLPGPADPEMLAAVGHANWVEFVGPSLKVLTRSRSRARRHRAAVELVAIAATPEQPRPHRPCHQRAIHSGPGWFPADNHGQRHSDLDLRRRLSRR
jgi:uncharacterized RmlC-like cupin family protein